VKVAGSCPILDDEKTDVLTKEWEIPVRVRVRGRGRVAKRVECGAVGEHHVIEYRTTWQ
jgi:hypothetical protein